MNFRIIPNSNGSFSVTPDTLFFKLKASLFTAFFWFDYEEKTDRVCYISYVWRRSLMSIRLLRPFGSSTSFWTLAFSEKKGDGYIY